MPMTPLLVDDLLRLTATALANRQQAQVTCHFRVSSVAGASLTVKEVADAWQAICDSAWPGVLAPTSFGGNCLVERVLVTGGAVAEYAEGVSTFPPGTVGTSHVPTQVAPIIKKFTGVAGPKHRGRVFMPFMPADFMTDAGELDPVGGTAYGLWHATVFARPMTLGTLPDQVVLTPVLFHRHPTASTTEDIALFTVSPKIGTQKRRGDYGTPNNVLG